MPAQLNREKLSLKKARYRDGTPVAPVQKRAEEAKAEVPPTLPAPPPEPPTVQVDLAPLNDLLEELKRCVKDMAKSMHDAPKPPPPKAAPEAWTFTLHRDRYGKIESVSATAK